MKEKELAKDLIIDANNFYNQGITVYPQIVIDKEEYVNYDISLLSAELDKEDFTLVDGTYAPEPYSLFPENIRKRKWFIYKQL